MERIQKFMSPRPRLLESRNIYIFCLQNRKNNTVLCDVLLYSFFYFLIYIYIYQYIYISTLHALTWKSQNLFKKAFFYIKPVIFRFVQKYINLLNAPWPLPPLVGSMTWFRALEENKTVEVENGFNWTTHHTLMLFLFSKLFISIYSLT